MKKLMFVVMALMGTTIFVTSCADEEEARMTDAEINATVDSLYELEAATLIEEKTLECMETMNQEVTSEVDRLVAKAEAAEKGETLTADPETDRNTDADMEADATTGKEEQTDEQIIQERLEERLAELRQELDEECTQQIMAQAKTKADSILIARDLEARYTAKGSTGTRTSGKATSTEADTDDNTPSPGTKPGSVEDRSGAAKKGEGGSVTDRPGANKKGEDGSVTNRPGANKKDDN